MEPEDLLEDLTGTNSTLGFIFTIAIFLLLISGLFSKAVADYGGVFGALARAIERRKKQAIDEDEASNARRIDRLSETVERLEGELRSLHEKDQIHHEYQLYVVSYWRELQFWAIEQGVTLPPPPMLSYPEWKEKHYPGVK